MTVQTPQITAGQPGAEHMDSCRQDVCHLDSGLPDSGHLSTGRLTLRPVSPCDVESFMAIAGDWEVARMTSDLPFPMTASQAGNWLSPGEDDTRFAIVKSGRMIGTIGYFIAAPGVAELGFILARTHWGWGYASEAVQAVVAHGLGSGDFERFTSAHFTTNVASARVLEKAGFHALGPQQVWCVSRACEMSALCYELSHKMAASLGYYRCSSTSSRGEFAGAPGIDRAGIEQPGLEQAGMDCIGTII